MTTTSGKSVRNFSSVMADLDREQSIAEYEVHDIAKMLPEMSEEEFQEFRGDCIEHGIREPIRLVDGKIYDGRHRYRVHIEDGVPAQFETRVMSNDEMVDEVVSLNLRRRNLTASQRSMATVRLFNWLERGEYKSVAAKAPNLNGSVEPSDSSGPADPSTSVHSETKTTGEMAKLAGVSRESIKRAKVAEKAGLGDAVSKGDLSLRSAVTLANQQRTGIVDPVEAKTAPKSLTRDQKDILILQAEIGRLKELLAKAHEHIDELEIELHAQAGARDETIYQEIKRELSQGANIAKSIVATRDRLMNEVAGYKRQVAAQRHEIEALKKPAAA